MLGHRPRFWQLCRVAIQPASCGFLTNAHSGKRYGNNGVALKFVPA